MYVKYLSQYLGQASNGEHENYLARCIIDWLTGRARTALIDSLSQLEHRMIMSQKYSYTNISRIIMTVMTSRRNPHFLNTFYIFQSKLYRNVSSRDVHTSLVINELLKS